MRKGKDALLMVLTVLCGLAACSGAEMDLMEGLSAVEPVSAPVADGPAAEEGDAIAALTRISQAPYHYREVRYWTLANGCTYSPAAGIGGWRWYLVANPLARGRPMVHRGCAIVFDDPGKSALRQRK